MSERRNATIRDVAELAGVAVSTASRALGGGSASKRTREKVMKAAEALRFVPNVSAQRLSSGHSNVVSIVVPESPGFLFADSFITGVISRLAVSLSRLDCQPFLALTPFDDNSGLGRLLDRSGAEALVVTSVHYSEDFIRLLEALDLPTVFIGRPIDAASYPYVDVDNYQGGVLAAERLVAKGHRHIAMLSGPADMRAPRERASGFQDALSQYGMICAAVRHGGFEREGGATAMQAVLDECPDVDAVFAHSDEMAAGAMQTLAAAGRRVPDDVAVIGFDDFRVSRSLTPTLTTVAQPLDQLAEGAVGMLDERLRTGEWGVRRKVYDVRLVERQSA